MTCAPHLLLGKLSSLVDGLHSYTIKEQVLTSPEVGSSLLWSLHFGSWQQKLGASGRPGGSHWGALMVLGEEDPGTQWKAVVSFWETGDA